MGKGKYESKLPNSLGLIEYTHDERATWKTLIERQNELIKGRACPEYIEGIKKLGLNDQIPQLKDVTSALQDITGWAVEPVPAVIPADHFFNLLAHKKFPSANFIRVPEEIDYLQEPDIFHEIYGHCPLLTNEAYANYMQEYGKLALKVSGKQRMRLFRLFWFTIEFGLLKNKNLNGTKLNYSIYGGGILSSKEETIYSVESSVPERLDLDIMTALRTPYRIDILQPIYFALDSLDDLFNILQQDLLKMVDQSLELGSFTPKYPPKDKINKSENTYE